MIVTHDLGVARLLSHRIIVMRGGEIAQSGTPRELYDAPNSVFVATFMGEANHVKGELRIGAQSAPALHLGPLVHPVPGTRCAAGPVDVVIRPEAIRLEPATPPGSLPATVRTATYMGANFEYVLDTAVGELFAVVPGTQISHTQGTQVGVTLGERGVFVLPPT